jgi:peroxiredoxin
MRRSYPSLFIALFLGILAALPAPTQDLPPSDVKPGRVEGTYFIGKTPGAHAEMTLELQNVQEHKQIPWAITDAAGHFAFETVTPGQYTVGHVQATEVMSAGTSTEFKRTCHTRCIVVKPGETTEVQIGGTGRKITGRMVAPADNKVKISWQGTMDRQILADHPRPRPPEGLSKEDAKKWEDAFVKSDAYNTLSAASLFITPEVEEDGAFSAVDVPPGNYTMQIDVGNNAQGPLNQNGPAGIAFLKFNVPPGGDDAPVDLGEVPVVMQANLVPGDAAPAFETPTMDGKTVRLAEFKGKYVLLYFWRSGYEVCTSQIAVLKLAQARFGSRDNFVILGLSTDTDRTDTEAFLKKEGLPWTQCWLGDEAGRKIAATYYSACLTPRIFLVDPEGKICARDLRDEELLKAAGDAFAVK